MSKTLALALVLVFLTSSSITIIQPAKAEVETVGTSCGIFVDNIVEGQPINIVVQIYPAPPSGETFHDLLVWITSPRHGVGGYGPWDKSHISTDTNGRAVVTFDISTFSGYWNVGLYFGGQYFANNTIYYQPINSQRGFSISSAQTPTPSPTTSPTPSPSPTPIATLTPSPSVPEFPSLIIPLLLGIMLTAGLLVYHKKHKHNSVKKV
jgi:hypothetical protein